MKKIFAFLFVACIISSIRAQIVSTVVGTGTSGNSGDGGPANQAELNSPQMITFDAAGNMFICDAGNNVIRKVDKNTGIISRVAGVYTGSGSFGGDGGQALSAHLNNPNQVIFDAAGNMYIADNGNSCIRKVNTSGVISTIAGIGGTNGYSGDGGPATSAKLFYPTSIAFNGGYLYICDMENHAIRRMDTTSGTITTICGSGTNNYSGDGGPAVNAELAYPWQITFDAGNNLYIADQDNRRIRVINPNGIINSMAGSTLNCTFTGDGGPATQATFCEPSGVYVDAAGNVYITDNGNADIRKVDQAGVITTIAGYSGINIDGGLVNDYYGDGNTPLFALFNSPYTATWDASGNIFVSDATDGVIREICYQINSVTGTVKDTLGNPVTAGIVYAFKRQTLHNGYIDTLGSSPISNGAYSFPGILGNNYLIKAIADTNIYHTAVPTYYSMHGGAFQWDSATILNNNPCAVVNSAGNDITIIQLPALSGPGMVSGNITAVAGYGQRGGPGNTVMGAPLKGVDVKLGRNPSGGAAARTSTDNAGNYTFVNVPLGSYRIYVDIPNYGMDSVLTITLTSGNSSSSNNNYFVDSMMVYPDTTGLTSVSSLSVGNSWKIYPNPAHNILFIEGAQNTGFEIYDLMGHLVRQIEPHISGKTAVDIGDLAKGIYFIRGGDVLHQRFMKE